MIKRVDVFPQEEIHQKELIRQAREFLELPITGLIQAESYLIKSEQVISGEHINEVFADAVLTSFRYLHQPPTWVGEVFFRPGVTDNIGKTAAEALGLLGYQVQAFSGKLFFFYGELTAEQAQSMGQELLYNDLLESFHLLTWDEFLQQKTPELPEVKLDSSINVQSYDVKKPMHELLELSRRQCWALNADELQHIQEFFAQEDVQKQRKSLGLSMQPTDVEIEMLAQTWSEHCKHKIFAATFDYQEEGLSENDVQLGNKKVESLYKTYIKGATKRVKEERKLDWLISVFSDNAGIVRFHDNVDLCIKVETHNSPSALDPYGGALTGILGVNRDILGCGLGAKPLANTDVFCFAPPKLINSTNKEQLPQGLKHPRRILEGVHKGIEDGGNKSGIPTINGAFFFHENFAGKPLVYCGTVGVLPQKLASGKPTSEKGQKPGHLVVVAGGRVGKDGIHGATFSSMELDETAPATAVQIGDPITQKRLSDFTLEARDLELYSSITDNGAGGISSSIGEMAVEAGGAQIDLAKVPLKYPGLTPYEILISESQERMSYSVAPEKWQAFQTLAKSRGVEATVIGEFTGSQNFTAFYGDKLVCSLPLTFLHDSLPPMQIPAIFTKEAPKLSSWIEVGKKVLPDVSTAVLEILKRPNICSKEPWVRQYDHEVKAMTVGKPFTGKKQDGPGDSGVLSLELEGTGEHSGVAVASGLLPRLSYEDSYLMAQYALDEAVRGVVASGADPSMVALVDNFCWPDPLPGPKNPDAAYKAAQLVRCCQGLYDMAVAYGMPFVSGKDSMKNDFIGKRADGNEVKISVPPTVLVTAMGKVPDTRKKVSSDFKQAGESIFLVGKLENSKHSPSEFSEMYQVGQTVCQKPNLGEHFKLYQRLHQLMQQALVSSCHDISEGGLVVALVESMIGGKLGADIRLPKTANVLPFLFNEATGLFLVSTHQPAKLTQTLKELPHLKLGVVTEKPQLVCDDLLALSLEELEAAWKEAL